MPGRYCPDRPWQVVRQWQGNSGRLRKRGKVALVLQHVADFFPATPRDRAAIRHLQGSAPASRCRDGERILVGIERGVEIALFHAQVTNSVVRNGKIALPSDILRVRTRKITEKGKGDPDSCRAQPTACLEI